MTLDALRRLKRIEIIEANEWLDAIDEARETAAENAKREAEKARAMKRGHG